MKFRKAVSVIAALAICSVLMPLSDIPVNSVVAQAEETTVTTMGSGECGDNAKWSLDSNGVLTISGKGAMKDYDNNSNLVPWKDYKSEITSVVIKEGITTVGDWSFANCSNLISATLPETLTTIGSHAFCECRKMTDVNIPSNVTTIKRYAFYSCRALTSIEIPESVTTIGDTAFGYCTAVTSIEIPESVTAISYSTFMNCWSLESVVIPESVETIGKGAFSECRVLTEVVLPAGVTLGEDVFEEGVTVSYGGVCGDNATWKYADGVLTISGTGAMYDYTGPSPAPWNVYKSEITSVVINDGITKIGNNSFIGHTAVINVEIPSSVTTIGGYVFYGCTSLTDITIPEGVTKIGNNLITGNHKITSISMPESLESMGSISNCDLKEIILPLSFKDKNITICDTAKLIYRTAWQFENIDMAKWQSGTLKFDATNTEGGTETSEGIIVADFVKEYSNANTILTGQGYINFNLIILDDYENWDLTRVYIEAAGADEASEIDLASGAFDPEAEIDEAEFIEIGDSEFDVE